VGWNDYPFETAKRWIKSRFFSYFFEMYGNGGSWNYDEICISDGGWLHGGIDYNVSLAGWKIYQKWEKKAESYYVMYFFADLMSCELFILCNGEALIY